MKRRWIIRSFFFGLLLLFVGGWALSYIYLYDATRYWGNSRRQVYAVWGKVHLLWQDEPGEKWQFGSVRLSTLPADASQDDLVVSMYGRHYYLGFQFRSEKGFVSASFPFWFFTTISAALLWLAWRKTRPKPIERAFPVEELP